MEQNEGFILLIDCLNQLLDQSGKRKQLTDLNKDKIMQVYDSAQSFLSVKDIQNFLKITEQKAFRLRTSGNCKASVSKNCMRLVPTQLSLKEQYLIKSYLENNELENLPVGYIWSEAQREGLMVSKDTFYKYTRSIRGVESKKKEKRKRPKTIPVRAEYPFQILHMDSTLIRCIDGERVYIHFIMDNYSRKVLGAIPSYSSKSKTVAQNLMQVIQKYQLEDKEIELYCDDGTENKGYVTELLSKNNIKIKKIVANHTTNRSNNMIEAWNKKFKRIVLQRFVINSFEDIEKRLTEMIDYHNNLKHPVLKTLTPNEVAEGVNYQDLEVKNKIEEAKKNRLDDNRKLLCQLQKINTRTELQCMAMEYLKSLLYPNGK